MNNYKLLASSGSIEGIRGLVARFYCCKPEDIRLSDDDNVGFLTVGKGNAVLSTRVMKRKCRFRFELKN